MFNLCCRYLCSRRTCVRLQRLAPERTSSETTSCTTLYNLSELHLLQYSLLFLTQHLVRKPSVSFTRQSETHSEFSTKMAKVDLSNPIRSPCAEIRFVRLPTTPKGTSCGLTIT